jgi:aminomethyltransferase
MSENKILKQTPLFDAHVALGARIVPFGGWEMPVQYDGILSEYQYTRESTAIFDISHMGEFLVTGDPVESGLDRIVTMPIVDMPVKSSRYGMILNDQGGVIDDLIIFRLEEKKWFLVVNGATTDKDKAHIQAHLNESATFEDLTLGTGKIDVQGPQSRDVLKGFIPGIEKLNYFAFDFFNVLGENVLVSRTGYTGELGYEIFYPWDKTQTLWNALMETKMVKPAGLGARDILRLEMGYSLYGHELNEKTSSLQSGLKRFINFEKDFIGRDALVKEQDEGLKRRIVGFVSDSRRSPREGQLLFSDEEKEIGVVTSGTFSPFLQKGIGLGFVDIDYAKVDNAISFGNEKNKNLAVISKRTFYNQGSLKN